MIPKKLAPHLMRGVPAVSGLREAVAQSDRMTDASA